MTANIYDTTILVNFPVSFKQKPLGGIATSIHNNVSSGGVVTYLSFGYKDKCRITRDTIGDAFASPVAYIVIGVWPRGNTIRQYAKSWVKEVAYQIPKTHT